MAYTGINKSTDYFNTKLYTGNGANGRAITGVGFKPDMIWFKQRSGSEAHNIYDIVRGAGQRIIPNSNGADTTKTDLQKSFDSDGFTVDLGDECNGNTATYAAWNWLAGGSQGSSNTDGSINTTYTSVNTTAGFSISKYTGTGSNATIGHGLGVVPKMMIVKVLSTNNQWFVYHQALGNTKKLNLDDTSAESVQNNLWNDTTPTSSVFSVGNHTGVNASGETYIAYCFAEKTGYSKFGSYTGNGNADGTFVYTGFKPVFVMTKKTSGTADWMIRDNKRLGYNGGWGDLYANTSGAEGTNDSNTQSDLLSNGFKLKMTHSNHNENGGSYIYMAFGQSLVGSNNVPCTAR